MVTLLARDIDIMILLMPTSYLSNVSSRRVQLEPTHTHLGSTLVNFRFFSGRLIQLLPVIETVCDSIISLMSDQTVFVFNGIPHTLLGLPDHEF